MNLDQALISGHGVTLPMALTTGGQTAVIGMGIVFAVLMILMLVLYLFGIIFHKAPKAEPVKEIIPEPIEEPEEDEEELIAVLTAAVAASLNTSTYNLRIKSYRRTGEIRSSWNRAGLNETITNRL